MLYSMKTLLMAVFCLSLTAACARGPVKIALVGSIQTGSESLRGFQLAAANLAASGGLLGRELEVVHFEDHENKDDCRKAVESAFAQGFRIIVLQTSSGAAEGALPWAADRDALILTHEISSPVWENRDDNLIRFVSPTDAFGIVLGRFAGKRGVKSAVMVTDERNKVYADYLSSGFRTQAPAIEIKGELGFGEGFQAEEIATWVLERNPESVFLVANGYDGALIVQNLARARYRGDLFLSPWSQNVHLLNLPSSLDRHMFIPGFFDPESDAPAYLSFAKKYRDAYNGEPDVWEMFGYETGVFLFDAARRAKSWDPMRVKKALLEKREYEGLQRPIRLDAEGDAFQESFIVTVADGKYVVME